MKQEENQGRSARNAAVHGEMILGCDHQGHRTLIAWLGFWILWVAIREVIIRQFGFEQPKAWPTYPLLILVMRILPSVLSIPFMKKLLLTVSFFMEARFCVHLPWQKNP